MIRVDIDEELHEADYDLIQRFSEALIDRDRIAMQEVLYMIEDRMSGDCSCLEVDCICGNW
tara:strand:+ start:1928 stop:2110 length:183 start_codon:yes stop_codon:yes gene_type:complete